MRVDMSINGIMSALFVSTSRVARRWAWLALGLLALLLPPSARAEGPLRLGEAQADVDAWPALTVLTDPDGAFSAETVLHNLSAFTVPQTPRANLGPGRDVVWLHLPLSVSARDDGRWVLEIDYAALDRIDVHLVDAGRVVRRAVLGDHLSFEERPLAARAHALALRLEPGRDVQLLLRVQTVSTVVVPVRLVKPEAFHARESRMQLVQGLAAGVGLCLLMYALAHWQGSRDPMFLYYAVTIAGVTLFFFAYHGLASQYLWPANLWLTDNMAALSILIGLAGALPLIERMLDVRALNRRLAQAMFAAAVVAVAVAVLFSLGLVGYRVAQVTGTLLGPLPMAMAVPVAWVRWRRGDPAAPYIFIGWAVYAVGVATMASLLRGWVDANAWTLNAFQAGSMFEMLMWLRVLGVRNTEARHLAERADREREIMQTLAHTDALTGLPNRRGLETALAAALPHADAQRMQAVFMLDLDGFKAINDRLGHAAGDELLVAVATRLKSHLRHSDIVARLGGDEFVILARNLGGEQNAWQLGRKLIEAFGQPFLLRGQLCSVGLTIGFALAPLDGSDAQALLKRADAAMYAGKQSGKGTVRRGAASVGLAGA
jgi:diguanylate cyclase (GGDEF)-like protein